LYSVLTGVQASNTNQDSKDEYIEDIIELAERKYGVKEGQGDTDSLGAATSVTKAETAISSSSQVINGQQSDRKLGPNASEDMFV
jgi:hypothetical protein